MLLTLEEVLSDARGKVKGGVTVQAFWYPVTVTIHSVEPGQDEELQLEAAWVTYGSGLLEYSPPQTGPIQSVGPADALVSAPGQFRVLSNVNFVTATRQIFPISPREEWQITLRPSSPAFGTMPGTPPQLFVSVNAGRNASVELEEAAGILRGLGPHPYSGQAHYTVSLYSESVRIT